MRTAAICPTCATYTNAVCVVYDGPYLSNLNINPLTNLEEIIGIIDNKVQLKLGFTPENVANKSTNTSLGTSNTLYPTQKAVKTYVDNAISTISALNLQQVLTSGNVATIGIQLNSPTISNVLFDGLRVFDSDVNFLYVRPSSIYWVGDEGDTTLQFSNTSGTYILTTPENNGTLAVSVNGVAAGTTGNVSINLQSVLDEGNSLSGGNNFQGTNAGTGNTGSYIIAFGLDAGENNTGSEVTAFGSGAAQGNQLSGVTVFSNLTLPTYANHTAASLAITVPLGATAGCTYLYHNQATNSIGAVRL